MSGGKSERKSTAVRRLEASLYFLKWTKTALQAYTRSVNELYLKALVEHVMKRKVDGSGDGDEVEQLAEGPKVEDKSENHTLRERLKEAAVRNTLWEGKATLKGNKVCVAEVAAMQRLTQLVKASGQLLDIMDRTHKWSDEHFKLLKKHPISSDLIDHVLTMFEATATLGEVFRLTSIDRSPCKEEYKDYMRKPDQDEYDKQSPEKLEIGVPDKYIPPLEAQINHYRTIVHILGTSVVSIIQTYLRYIPQEQVDLRVREVKDVLDRLPPMYLKVKDMTVSKAAADVLKDAPPNKRSYPLAPKEDCSARAATRSGKTVRSSRNRDKSSRKSKRSGSNLKVLKSKYKNPMNSNRSSRSKRASSMRTQSEKSEKKRKSESSGVKKADDSSK